MADETDKTSETTESKTDKSESNGEAKAAESTAAPEPAKSAEASVKAASSSSATATAARIDRDKDRNLFAMAAETMKHVERCEKDKSIVFRHSDRKSVIFMLTAFALEVALMILFVVDPGFRPVCIALAVAADILFGLAILWYVLLRFGVLRSFEPRQTLLTWQLMIGSGALFAFYTMNIAFAFFTYYNSLASAPPPPPL